MANIRAGQHSLFFRWSGTENIRKQLHELQSGAPVAIATALYEEAEALMTEIKENHVPVDQGPLRASGFVHLPRPLPGGGWIVRLGFGGAAAPYAWKVHENPRSGRTGGISPTGQRYRSWAKVGHWKYFERPFLSFIKGLNQRVGKRIATIWFRKVSKNK